MHRVEYLIGGRIKENKISSKVKNYQACALWQRIVAKHMPEAADKTLALSLEKGCLKVAALSQEIADQILSYQKRLLYDLNAAVGEDIAFKVWCEV